MQIMVDVMGIPRKMLLVGVVCGAMFRTERGALIFRCGWVGVVLCVWCIDLCADCGGIVCTLASSSYLFVVDFNQSLPLALYA